MALNIVEIPYSYFPDFNRGRPLFNASIFVGEVDTDPENPVNQKQVTVRQENGNEVPVDQPVLTSSGGVPIYNGGPVAILVDGAYSVKVLDSSGQQEYYSPDVTKGVPLTPETLPTYTDLVFDSVAEAIQAVIDGTAPLSSKLRVEDYYGGASPNNSGVLFFEVVNAGSGTADGGLYIDAGSFQLRQNIGSDVNVKKWGAIGDLSAPTDSHIQAAINYAESLSTSGVTRGSNVYIPEGQYLLTSTLTISESRVSLKGFGSYQTVLVRNSNYGNTIDIISETAGALNTLERIEVSGLSFFHDVSVTGMTDAHIKIASVTHGYITDINITNGAYGIQVYGCVELNIEECAIISPLENSAFGVIGILLTDAEETGFDSSGVVHLPTQVAINGCEVFGPLNGGWGNGVVVNAAEDIVFSNSYLGNNKNYNLLLEQTSNNYLILEVSVTNGTYIDGSGLNSVGIFGGNGDGSTYIGTASFVGCDIKGQGGQTKNGIFIDGTPRAGAYSQACRNLRIVGCRIGDYDESGIVLNGGTNTVIEGNIIGGNNYNNSTSGRGIIVGSNSERASIIGNRIGGLPEGGGTSLQSSGIELVSGCSEIHVSDNDLRHNVTSLVDGAQDAQVSGKRIINNIGYNENRPIQSPTIPASGVELFNPIGSPAFVSIFGGTVTDIKLNGQTIDGTTPSRFTVSPGDRISIVYSVAPGWVWWPQ